MRICVVSPEFVGPYKNGGVGTASTSLAELLAADGHEVTCLFTPYWRPKETEIEQWFDLYRQKGITLVLLPESAVRMQGYSQATRSFEIYAWLKERKFELIHFAEMEGPGYCSLQARRLGIAFQNTFIAVGCHSPVFWIREASGDLLSTMEEAIADFLERESIRLADMAWSPSWYLMDWMKCNGYRLPAENFVRPYVVPVAVKQSERAQRRTGAIREVVFFGRLESRKGVTLFCDAMDLLAAQPPKELQITFLGKHSWVNGRKSEDYIEERMKKWPFKTRLISEYSQPEAVAYLKEEGRLAIMASPVDNSPNTVYEAIGMGIPFFACRGGGIPELIHPEDVEKVCFDWQPEALAEKIQGALQNGAQTARWAFEPEANEAGWRRWHQELALPRASARKETSAPLVSICIPPNSVDSDIEQVLESIAKQEYKNLEVLIFTARDQELRKSLQPWTETFGEAGLQVIFEKNSGRFIEASAAKARGDFCLLLRPGNFLRPGCVKTFVEAACHSEADALYSCYDLTFGADSTLQDSTKYRHASVGAGGIVGCFENRAANECVFVRRKTLEKFERPNACNVEAIADWELKSFLEAHSERVYVVPEALYCARPVSPSESALFKHDLARSARALDSALPVHLSGLARFARCFYIRSSRHMKEMPPQPEEVSCSQQRFFNRFLTYKHRRSIRKRLRKILSWFEEVRT